ncbi:hypothetical protein B0T45_13875 [Chromobacterium haemolyticum]|uniref:Uncharacterized protein n=2 Tax=Chromobacterium haemolyticum TaxID=394935 RepID=A0A1W0CSP1_9NEIS|nr:hypothetical protein B0T45_13875 [Chromobacterium haemolyticum]
MTDIDVVDVRIISSPAEARMQCEAYIEQHYPLWRQMNVLRAGTAEEQARMGRFIDTCRAWSNVEQPDPTELEKLKPE